MDALIFDLDGVLVDSEPLHLRTFQQVLACEKLTLTEQAYFDCYLGYDDRDAFAAVARDNGREFSPEDITRLIAKKTALLKKLLADITPMPGAVELVRQAADADVPMAVCSGALREEVELACRAIGLLDCFRTVVSADQVGRSKPDPESYRLSLQRLTESTGKPLDAAKVVAVEDTPAGIESARGAGMKTLAVTNSYPADALAAADRIVTSLADVALADLEALVQ